MKKRLSLRIAEVILAVVGALALAYLSCVLLWPTVFFEWSLRTDLFGKTTQTMSMLSILLGWACFLTVSWFLGWRRFASIYGSVAAVVFAVCIWHGMPLNPLSPHYFEHLGIITLLFVIPLGGLVSAFIQPSIPMYSEREHPSV